MLRGAALYSHLMDMNSSDGPGGAASQQEGSGERVSQEVRSREEVGREEVRREVSLRVAQGSM